MFTGHNLTSCSLCPSSVLPPLANQPQPKRVVEGPCRGGVWEGWPYQLYLALSVSSSSVAVAFPDKCCAFLLQLSEELTKGEMQLCSHVLIISCSVAHLTGHHHLERASGPKRSFSFSLWRTVLFDLIFPLSSHVISHGFRYVGQEERGGGGK